MKRGDRRVSAPVVLGALGAAAAGIVAASVARNGGTVKVVIPAGTRIVASLDRTLSTRRVEAGEPVALHTVRPLELPDGVTVPEGMTVEGEVTHARDGGRIHGAPELTIRFHRLALQGEEREIEADPFRMRGKSDLAESAAYVGGGALAGGVVGALAGNTTAGVAAGAVLGTGTAIATRGDHIILPAGQRIRIRLAAPVTLRFKPARESDRTS